MTSSQSLNWVVARSLTRNNSNSPLLQHRTVVTYNVDDFVALVAEWFLAGRTHYGVLLVKQASIRREDIGGLVRALAVVLDTHPGDEDFLNGCDFLRPVP